MVVAEKRAARARLPRLVIERGGVAVVLACARARDADVEALVVPLVVQPREVAAVAFKAAAGRRRRHHAQRADLP
ncbi:hypothetical protein SDC9_205488 [bioreactor metagenome]|uniref:Uncharacterized protein n=1 Tax=bioreactor metagenome TaxID=1076179 RepID=A0A645JBN2_9ZZZZ